MRKILAWQLTEVKNKSEVIAEARNKSHAVHFVSLMGLCHLKKSELEPQFKKYKGRVVLLGDKANEELGTLADNTRPTQCVCSAHSFHLHAIHDERLIVRSLSVSSCLSFSCFSPLFTSSLPHSTCTLTSTSSPMSTASRELTSAPSHNEEYCPMAFYNPLTTDGRTTRKTSLTAMGSIRKAMKGLVGGAAHRLGRLSKELSGKFKTVLELYNMEIHQKKAGPGYYRLKTMVKRRIEQNLRNKNFGARNGNYERNAVVKNQGTKQREQRILGHCWQWKTNGQCSKGDNSSSRHDVNKRAKPTQPNPSPNSFMQQNERNASGTRGP